MHVAGTYLHEGEPLVVGQVEGRSHFKTAAPIHTATRRLTSARSPQDY
jgi:hypothetical protein